MKGVVITTDNKMRVEDFEEPLYKSVGKVVGGWIELVHPAGLAKPYCMIVNEEGLLEDLPLNDVGCVLYGTYKHGNPIVGNIVLMKDGYVDGEPDIVGLTDEEAAGLGRIAIAISKGAVSWDNAPAE